MIRDAFYRALEVENQPPYIADYHNYYHDIIFPFYEQKGTAFTLPGSGGATLSCRAFVTENAKAVIVLATGYNESYFKYSELIYNLCQEGYSIFCYDHRGQGFSHKFPNQRRRGYVDSFSAFVDDFATIYNHVEARNPGLPISVVAHSMGGAVVTLAVCEGLVKPRSVVLSAPMYEVRVSPWSVFELPIYALSKVMQCLGQDRMYIPGQKDCMLNWPFEKNDVTHSSARFAVWRKHVRDMLPLQLGGPTFAWAREAVLACRKVRKLGKQMNVPLLLLQAEADTIVRNSAHDLFLHDCPTGKKIVLEHSKHELLMEIDFIRDRAVQAILQFIG